MTRTVAYKHRRPARWLHWANAALLFMMTWSGLMIYWASPDFGVVPDRFLEKAGLSYRLAYGMGVHFFVGWLFVLNGLVYAAWLALSGDWRPLTPERRSWLGAIRVTLHDLHLIRDAPPQGKFNDAQRLAYTAVVLMGAGSAITGLALYKPTQLSELNALLGGYQRVRLEHFAFMLGFAAFLFVHVAQVARAGWNNLRAMISGWEVVSEETR